MFAVNLSGAEFGSGNRYGYDYIYPSSSTLQYYASKGVDTVRLPFKWERIQQTLNGELDQAELGRIKTFLTDAQANGLKVILDVHNFGAYNGQAIGSDGVPVSAFQDLWGKLAGALKDFPALDGYGLMNEPVGMKDASVWPTAAQAAIDTIRGIDSQTAIYVAGDGWGGANTWKAINAGLAALKDSSGNLVFEAHQYFDQWGSGTYAGSYDTEKAYSTVGVDKLQPFIEWLKENNLKGFIGEYSIPDNDPRWQAVMDNFLGELQKNNIGSAYWGAGPWWGSYPMSIEPENGIDSAQMDILEKHIASYKESLLAEAEIPVPTGPQTYEIFGTVENETLTGKDNFINVLHGGAGNDIITGKSANDALYGDAGNDTLNGGDGNDVLDGGAGDDLLYGAGGDDILEGGAGNDSIRAGLGADTLYGGEGDDRLYGDEGDDILDGGAGNDRLEGGAGDDYIDGKEGDDTVIGQDGNDTIWGREGNDSLSGGNGNDIIYAGTGDDKVFGDDGDDVLYGNDGNDTIQGGKGDDYINGNAGDDYLTGHDGNDVILGESGNDTLYGGNGNDQLSGGDGNDKLIADAGDDVLEGGAGNDRLEGGAGNDILLGQDGDDALYGQDGDDRLNGGMGNDRLYGGAGDDILDGGEGDDIVAGDGGNDTLSGGAGADTLEGGAGNDSLSGGDGNDVLRGGAGDDVLYGDTGKDVLYGQEGNDILYGGADDDSLHGQDGDDIISGQAGSDLLYGEAGADTFLFDMATAFSGIDSIRDFNLAQGDRIDVSNLLGAYDPLTQSITDFVQITTNGNYSLLKIDIDGGGNNFVQIATIVGVQGLTDEQALVNNGSLVVS